MNEAKRHGMRSLVRGGALCLLMAACGPADVDSSDSDEAASPLLAASGTVTVGAKDDAYVNSAAPNAIANTANLLTDSGVRTFIKFKLPAIPAGTVMVKAVLKLTVQGGTSGSASPPAVYSASNNWTEEQITWAKRPWGGSVIWSQLPKLAAGAVHNVDLMDAVYGLKAGMDVSFMLHPSDGTDGTVFWSKEAKDPKVRPTLTISYAPMHYGLASNIASNSCEVYNMIRGAKSNGEVFTGAPVWSWSARDDRAIPDGWFDWPTDCKFRKNPVAYEAGPLYRAGHLLLVSDTARGPNGGHVAIVDRRTKKALFTAWEHTPTDYHAPHSLELLPDGNLVVVGQGYEARGSGNCPGDFSVDPVNVNKKFGMLRIHDVKTGKYKNQTLCFAHGASWDDARNVMWFTTFHYLIKARYNGFASGHPFEKIAAYPVPNGPAKKTARHYSHDVRVMPNGHIQMNTMDSSFEFDPSAKSGAGAWLAASAANCTFKTSAFRCTPGGLPNYGADSNNQKIKGLDIDSTPSRKVGFMTSADGTGDGDQSGITNSISVFATGSLPYRIQNPSAAFYKIRVWEPR